MKSTVQGSWAGTAVTILTALVVGVGSWWLDRAPASVRGRLEIAPQVEGRELVGLYRLTAQELPRASR